MNVDLVPRREQAANHGLAHLAEPDESNFHAHPPDNALDENALAFFFQRRQLLELPDLIDGRPHGRVGVSLDEDLNQYWPLGFANLLPAPSQSFSDVARLFHAAG